jgi:hypothetical protein
LLYITLSPMLKIINYLSKIICRYIIPLKPREGNLDNLSI